MRSLKRFLTLLFLIQSSLAFSMSCEQCLTGVLFILGSNFAAYNYGKKNADHDLYKQGKRNGFDRGYDKGIEKGFCLGFDNGYDKGRRHRKHEEKVKNTLTHEQDVPPEQSMPDSHPYTTRSKTKKLLNMAKKNQ